MRHCLPKWQAHYIEPYVDIIGVKAIEAAVVKSEAGVVYPIDTRV